MYFVDIVVSYDFCAAVQRINFFFSLSITLYIYHCCWWIKLIKKWNWMKRKWMSLLS